MTTPKPDTRKLIMDTAEALLLGRSFSAFSYQHIAQALGVRNAAIHYHFPSKTDLGVALIERYRRRFRRWTDEQRTLSQDPWQQLEWYFDLVTSYYDQDQQICPTGILSAEFLVLPPEMQRQTQLFVADMLGWCEEILTAGQADGYMRFTGAAKGMAFQLMAALQGALQLARVNDSSDLLDEVKQQLRVQLGASGQLS